MLGRTSTKNGGINYCILAMYDAMQPSFRGVVIPFGYLRVYTENDAIHINYGIGLRINNKNRFFPFRFDSETKDRLENFHQLLSNREGKDIQRLRETHRLLKETL